MGFGEGTRGGGGRTGLIEWGSAVVERSNLTWHNRIGSCFIHIFDWDRFVPY